MNYNLDYYKILEVDKNSSDDDIKKSYRNLAKKHHPDITKNANDEKFKEINEAFSILSDDKLKQEYDQRSPHGKSYSPFNSFGNSFEFHFGGGDDLFSQFFGGFRKGPFGFDNFFRREEFVENLDINLDVNVNLRQIYLNENLNIKYNRFVLCNDCGGSGFDNSSHSEVCEICEGTGIYQRHKCTYCDGTGNIHTGKCKTCNGEKVILKESELNLQNISRIRSNVKNIQRMYGHQSKHYKEKVGSLILNINVDRNDNYEIVNNFDLHKEIDVHFQDAIDGNEILYTHIDNNILKIKLPTKTKNDDIIRIKDKGLLIDNLQRSDLYLKINIIIDYEKV